MLCIAVNVASFPLLANCEVPSRFRSQGQACSQGRAVHLLSRFRDLASPRISVGRHRYPFRDQACKRTIAVHHLQGHLGERRKFKRGPANEKPT